MNIRLSHLSLHCKSGTRDLDLDHEIVLFLGELNTGKTTALHLIDYCLGAKDLYETQALRKEFLSVRLEMMIAGYNVIIERERSSRANVTWRYGAGKPRSELVPVRAQEPLEEIEPGVFTLSDLFFHLSGLDVLKVRKAPSDPESDLIRLSFRDLMFYCFIQQRYSDSNFFRLDDAARLKSRDAIRFVCGFYSARLSALSVRLDELRKQRESNDLSVERLSRALKEVSGGESLEELLQSEKQLDEEVKAARVALSHINESYASATHITDDLRQTLRRLSGEIDERAQAVERQEIRVGELESLRSEFVSLKYKTERSQVALAVLDNANYEYCPQCTRELDAAAEGICQLCKADLHSKTHLSPEFLEASRRDLNSRLLDVDNAIATHQEALKRERRHLNRLKIEKRERDVELSEMLKRYNADYLERFRHAERHNARLTGELERVRSLINLYRNILTTQSSNAALEQEIRAVRQAIDDEQKTLTQAQARVNAIQDTFIENLRLVGVPGIENEDRAIINTRTWFPRIYNKNDPTDYWDFESAGSNGRRVLFAVNYALAIHQVAQSENLPLPTLLMLDTPTKDVARDVNAAIHDAMDDRLYTLSTSSLDKTQLIIADSTFTTPPGDVDAATYHFTRDSGLVPNYTE